ncbi:beta transducin-like protein HET-E2C*4 [Phaeosphaeria sp. MPI-PUGE-AT-0046c]|nr:beta transducin-like protein HET-E2C*4 [Phaeosphaeria sp. MPI-PUGE-AT-0046c]
MRLLQRNGIDDYVLTNRFDDESTIPSYAILSHTWGKDADEITLQDLVHGNGQAKAGYEKLRFCGEQAWKAGIQYFWIDTCCIDKTNKAELSHAIESMFRWNSPWFTRGWTLQELLAPKSVEFFSNEGQRLGDKKSLTQQIHEITAIPPSALQGTPLHHFSVEERLRWKGARKTKLAEDGAYSIAGLFSVFLAPVYGEGAELAYRRLNDEIRRTEECIRDIRLTDPRDDQKRIEDTKGGLLRESYRWVLDNTSFQQWQVNSSNSLLWIKGDPGKGKTMLLCGIVNELKASLHDALIASFFCQATDSSLNSANTVLRGLLYLLVDQQPRLAYQIRKRYDAVGSRTLFEDANAGTVLKETFTQVLKDSSLPTTYLIVDALDECTTDLPKLLDFIREHSSVSSRVKWLVSSRNWPEIEQQLEQTDQQVRLSLEVNSKLVTVAVDNFIRQKVSLLSSLKKLDDMTHDAVLNHLLSNANSTFLWVSLVCQALQETSKRHIHKKLESFPPGLTCLYERMMDQISGSDDAEVCTRILAISTLVFRPLTIKELPALMEELEEDDSETVLELVGLCGSFLTLRDGIVYFVHQSAKEFLLNGAAGELFPTGKHDVHHTIAARSLHLMFCDLHRDMYDLRDPDYDFNAGKDLPPESDPLEAFRYSCIHWVDHLRESLSLCGQLGGGISLLEKLGSLVEPLSTLYDLIKDAHRFIMYHLPLVQVFPLQLYASALIFSPSTSIVRHCFHHEKSEWYSISPFLDAHWSACLATLEYQGSTIAISQSLSLLAIAERDYGKVRLLDMNSYANLGTLRHPYVNAIAFSGQSNLLIWNATKGVCLTIFEEGIAHESINCIAFSDVLVASASEDRRLRYVDLETSDDDVFAVKKPGTIKVWKVSNEPTIVMLRHADEDDSFNAVAFSPDAKQLVSGSKKSIRIWNISSGICQMELQGHTDEFQCVIFSSDQKLLASGSYDETVKIWDAANGECLKTLKRHFLVVNSIVFSPDSKWLASVSEDCLVVLWDVKSGTLVKCFKGHANGVSSVAFSDPTRLVTAASLGTMKVWDATNANTEMVARDDHHCDGIVVAAYSQESKLLATSLDDDRIKIWNTEDGTLLHSLTVRCSTTHLMWSYSSQLVVVLDHFYVQIWNIDGNEAICSGEFLTEIHNVGSLVISHDSTTLALCSEQLMIRRENTEYIELWDLSSASRIHRLKVSNDTRDLSFSPDDS